MPYRKYAAEFLGTLALAFAVWSAIALQSPFPIAPVAAGLALGLFVYTVGGISGAHLNPAVTIGVLSVGKIRTSDAMLYIVCQLAGGAVAMMIGGLLGGQATAAYATTIQAGIAEAIGTFILAFGVLSAVLQKVPPAASGLVVGGSLMLGAFVASVFGNGILNPAVALSINAFGPMEIVGPIVGAVAGAWSRMWLEGKA